MRFGQQILVELHDPLCPLEPIQLARIEVSAHQVHRQGCFGWRARTGLSLKLVSDEP
jgi:hypothetical protein